MLMCFKSQCYYYCAISYKVVAPPNIDAICYDDESKRMMIASVISGHADQLKGEFCVWYSMGLKKPLKESSM
jgi:hypothetical protein